MRKFLDAGNAPGCPEIKKDHCLGEKVAQLVGIAGEILQRKIDGFLGFRGERTEKAQTPDKTTKMDKKTFHPKGLAPGRPRIYFREQTGVKAIGLL